MRGVRTPAVESVSHAPGNRMVADVGDVNSIRITPSLPALTGRPLYGHEMHWPPLYIVDRSGEMGVDDGARGDVPLRVAIRLYVKIWSRPAARSSRRCCTRSPIHSDSTRARRRDGRPERQPQRIDVISERRTSCHVLGDRRTPGGDPASSQPTPMATAWLNGSSGPALRRRRVARRERTPCPSRIRAGRWAIRWATP